MVKTQTDIAKFTSGVKDGLRRNRSVSNRLFFILTMAVFISLVNGSSWASDYIYVVTSDGYLIGFDGMSRGMSNTYGGSGDTSFGYQSLGKSIGSVVTADLSDGPYPEVLVGTDSGSADEIHIYNETLEALLDRVVVGERINSMAAGQIGRIGPGLAAGTNTRLIVYDDQLNWAIERASATPIKAVTLAQLQTTLANQEIVAAAISGTDKSTSRIEAYSVAVLNNQLTMPALWPTWSPDNVITDLAAGDLDNAYSNDEMVITGNSTPGSGNIKGDGTQAYAGAGSGSFQPLWYNNLTQTPPLNTTEAVAIADVWGDLGMEVITAGDSRLYIVEGNPSNGIAANLQIIETNQPCTSIVVADVLGDDSSKEIVVGSANGLVLVYEHADPLDPNSPFTIVPDGSRGGVIYLDPEGDGSQYQVTDIAGSVLCPNGNTADFDGNCLVEMIDFSRFAGYWLHTQ